MPMQLPAVSLLVTDLDNTLYDWVSFFACAFYDMVAVASRILDVDEERLLDDLRAVHQRMHSSEHPYSLLETDTVRARFGHLSRSKQAQHLDDAFHQFNRTRNATLKLYEGVASGLRRLQARGTLVVGHTEATVPNALFRLRKLGVEKFFCRLYAVTPQGTEPYGVSAEPTTSTIDVHFLPTGERKPNPKVLLDVCGELEVPIEKALYVGDSISRDVGMAKSAGMGAAWAKYGTDYDPEDWKRLVRITHWTPEDVRRAEEAAEKYSHACPDAVLQRSFEELFEHFQFNPTRSRGPENGKTEEPCEGIASSVPVSQPD
jgi:phosphoglycolate phosphatase